jgi:hypothetical protein
MNPPPGRTRALAPLLAALLLASCTGSARPVTPDTAHPDEAAWLQGVLARPDTPPKLAPLPYREALPAPEARVEPPDAPVLLSAPPPPVEDPRPPEPKAKPEKPHASFIYVFSTTTYDVFYDGDFMGTYGPTVKLRISNGSGCTDVVIKTGTMAPLRAYFSDENLDEDKLDEVDLDDLEAKSIGHDAGRSSLHFSACSVRVKK